MLSAFSSLGTSLGSLIGMGAMNSGSIIGGILGYGASKDMGKYAVRIAKQQMKWQEKMANTAHQREVEDLRSAGLNPILSATGGNGAPMPSTATPSLESGADSLRGLFGDSIMDILGTFSALRKQDAETRVAEAQARNINSATQGVELDNAIKNIDMQSASALKKAEVLLSENKVAQAKETLRKMVTQTDVDVANAKFWLTPEGRSLFKARQYKDSYDTTGWGLIKTGGFGLNAIIDKLVDGYVEMLKKPKNVQNNFYEKKEPGFINVL